MNEVKFFRLGIVKDNSSAKKLGKIGVNKSAQEKIFNYLDKLVRLEGVPQYIKAETFSQNIKNATGELFLPNEQLRAYLNLLEQQQKLEVTKSRKMFSSDITGKLKELKSAAINRLPNPEQASDKSVLMFGLDDSHKAHSHQLDWIKTNLGNFKKQGFKNIILNLDLPSSEKPGFEFFKGTYTDTYSKTVDKLLSSKNLLSINNLISEDSSILVLLGQHAPEETSMYFETLKNGILSARTNHPDTNKSDSSQTNDKENYTRSHSQLGRTAKELGFEVKHLHPLDENAVEQIAQEEAKKDIISGLKSFQGNTKLQIRKDKSGNLAPNTALSLLDDALDHLISTIEGTDNSGEPSLNPLDYSSYEEFEKQEELENSQRQDLADFIESSDGDSIVISDKESTAIDIYGDSFSALLYQNKAIPCVTVNLETSSSSSSSNPLKFFNKAKNLQAISLAEAINVGSLDQAQIITFPESQNSWLKDFSEEEDLNIKYRSKELQPEGFDLRANIRPGHTSSIENIERDYAGNITDYTDSQKYNAYNSSSEEAAHHQDAVIVIPTKTSE